MASAYLAPSSRPATSGFHVSVCPCSRSLPNRRAISGMYEQTKHSTMPQNAARNGVKSSSSIVTNAIRGNTRCQLSPITRESLGMRWASTPASFSRFASKWTIVRHAK